MPIVATKYYCFTNDSVNGFCIYVEFTSTLLQNIQHIILKNVEHCRIISNKPHIEQPMAYGIDMLFADGSLSCVHFEGELLIMHS